jgi:hypothetical protein
MLWVRCLDTVEETRVLIKACREELNRLHQQAAAFNRAITTSRDLLAGASWRELECTIPAPKAELPFSLISPYPDWLRARSEETRCFAESVKDPAVRRLLLQLADTYDKQAEGLASPPA